MLIVIPAERCVGADVLAEAEVPAFWAGTLAAEIPVFAGMTALRAVNAYRAFPANIEGA